MDARVEETVTLDVQLLSAWKGPRRERMKQGMIVEETMGTIFSRLEVRAKNLHDMMQYCAVDTKTLALDSCGQTAEAIARACFFCRRTDACRHWLDTADQNAANEPPSFCPNSWRFRKVRFS